MKKICGILTLTALLVVGCTNTSTLNQEKVFIQYPTVSSLHSLIVNAKSQEWDLLSPLNLKNAEAVYSESYSKASKQVSGADRIAEEGIASIERAQKQVDVAKYELRDVLSARARALQASTSIATDKEFVDTDDKLRDLAQKLEEGKKPKVRADRADLEQQYSALELQALKQDTVQEATKALELAKKANVDDLAPLTIKAAEEELSLAKKIIETDRQAKEKSKMHAQMAIWNVSRATQISETIKEIKQSNLSDEGIVIWYQEQIETALGDSANADFSAKNSVMISRVVQQLKQQRSRVSELELALAGQKTELGDNELKLSKLQKNDEEVKAKFAKVQANFNADEAEVYRQGNNVLIRTYGFTFPTGSSEIQSSNFPLLNKIEESIGLFEGSFIEVSGHTDSRGSDAINDTLSDERASKVAGFLVSVGGIASDRVSSKGYGKTKPIASNDNAEGRTQNRRVEILIKNK